jgi:3-methyladenine DNA glycosylase AlkD
MPTHADVIKALKAKATAAGRTEVARYFHGLPGDTTTRFLGISIGRIFPIAKAFTALPLDQVERLLESPYYEARMAAAAILDFKARAPRVTTAERKALYELYMRRHDRIDNWDLVDRAAAHVVGGYLADRSRRVLHTLARSKNPWQRRTAIVATWFFIRQNDVDDTFAIAERLVRDPHVLVQKAVGGWVREAGKRAPSRLTAFLDRHAARMPREMLRQAIENLPPAARKAYLAAAKDDA